MPSPGNEYLVSYDIACPKRWRRVFRLLQGYGEWAQLSLFRCRLDARRHARMAAELRELIDTGEDRLLIARLDEEALTEASTPEAESTPPRPGARTNGRAIIL